MSGLDIKYVGFKLSTEDKQGLYVFMVKIEKRYAKYMGSVVSKIKVAENRQIHDQKFN